MYIGCLRPIALNRGLKASTIGIIQLTARFVISERKRSKAADTVRWKVGL